MGTATISHSVRRLSGFAAILALRTISAVLPSGAARRGESVPQTAELDRTGILVERAEPLEIRWKDDEVIFPMYPASLAHSFWRAQEFSLFMQNRSRLRPPVLDFGCGDGSFAAVLFPRLDYGSDIDDHALKIAAGFRVYDHLVHSPDTKIPLPDGAVNSVFSNSVLEHVQDLRAVMRETHRVLAPGGVLMFTVPVKQFARDLATFFGQRESDDVNADFYHRNLLEIDEWRSLLTGSGFTLEVVRQFQPDWFTHEYWMLRFLGRRGLGRIVPSIRERVWRARSASFVEKVRRSISGKTQSGGNIFIVAVKT